MSDNLRVFIEEDKVNARIKELGEQISKDYAGKKLDVICILRGASFFACELAKRITVPVEMNFITVSSYDGTTSTGNVKIKNGLDDPIDGKDVLIVEDIIDTGNTLSRVKELFLAKNPKSVKICTLLDKPARRQVDIQSDYVGFKVPDEFIVGYGLDYNQLYRNLPYIGIFTP